jgi:DNA repair protein RecO (recombination protein O)
MADAGEGARVAVVLRLQDYRETDRLVWLLTAERGRVSAVARGARKSQRRFGGHLDLFQKVLVRITGGRGALHTVQEARALDAWPRLRSDVPRYAVASFLAELASGLSREEAPDATLFGALTGAFAGLDDPGTAATPATAAAGIVQLLTAAGFAPDLSQCGGCGAALAPTAGGDAQPGGAVLEPGGRLWCARCDPAPARGPGRRLSPADTAALTAWQTRPGATALLVPGGAEAVGAARDLLREVAPRALKSEAFLWEIVR